MDEDELNAALEVADRVAGFSYRNSEVDDDFVDAELYRMPDGRHFRLITMSGFASNWSGEMNSGEWLDEAGVANWTDLGQGDGPEITTFED